MPHKPAGKEAWQVYRYFAQELKNARTRNSWTQERLAALAGLTQPSVSKYETGKILPGEREFSLLCACFDDPRWKRRLSDSYRADLLNGGSVRDRVMSDCPYCGRWLATWHMDGTFDVARNASVTTKVVGDRSGRLKSVPLATCYRLRCRLRRFRAARRGVLHLGVVKPSDDPPVA
jgi:DNA-binding XRE family transcriptional regulator